MTIEDFLSRLARTPRHWFLELGIQGRPVLRFTASDGHQGSIVTSDLFSGLSELDRLLVFSAAENVSEATSPLRDRILLACFCLAPSQPPGDES